MLFIQEAENLYVWIEEDKELLLAKGLDWEMFIEDLPIRTGACRYAQAMWMKERYKPGGSIQSLERKIS